MSDYDIYDVDYNDIMLDDDEISVVEAGFMQGYLDFDF